MIRKLKWFWIGMLLLLLVYLPFQIPWGASIERPILAQLKKDGITDDIPRTASGKIDFVAVVNEAHYVPPEENMLVDVLRLLGPEKNTKPELLEILGNPQIEEDPLVDFGKYIYYQHPEMSDDDGLTEERVQEKPWTAISEPIAAEWLERCGNRIDQLVRASQKPKWYSPLCCDGESTLASAASFAEAGKVRDVAMILSCQLNFHLGNNDLDRAIANYVAIQRYSLAVMEGPFLIDQVIGIAACGIGYKTLGSLLEADSINEQHLKTLRTAIANAASQTADKRLRTAERYYVLELLGTVSAGGGSDMLAASEMFGETDQALRLVATLRRVTNWEIATVECLKWFESVDHCLQIENDFDRLNGLEQWEIELEEAGNAQLNNRGLWFKRLAGAGPRGQLAGQILSSRYLSAYRSIETAAIRTRIQFDIGQIGIAIELHHLKHGDYPEKLDDLVPEFLAAVPIDRYTNGPLTYVKTESHYFLCSVGPDQINSIQQIIDDDNEASGWTVDDRYTLLKVKLRD